MSVRVLIADDHNLLRAGLRSLLSESTEFEVIGETGDGEATLELARRLEPDLLLLDLTMPGCDGIEVTHQLHADLPGTRILILTAHEDPALLHRALSEGASGYVVKGAVETELLNALRAVRNGDLYVHPRMTRALLNPVPAALEDSPRLEDLLTEREQEVFHLIALGYSNSQMAEKLCLAVRTVETHRWRIMHKLDLRSRSAVVRYAIDHGYLKREG